VKLYKDGAKGATTLIHGQKVFKTDIRVEACRTCMKQFAHLLKCLLNESFAGKEEVANVLHDIQKELFYVGSELATPVEEVVKWRLEKMIDHWDEVLDPLNNFNLPGAIPLGRRFMQPVQLSKERNEKL
jgi:cob(I)alamin adenosyltransferase